MACIVIVEGIYMIWDGEQGLHVLPTYEGQRTTW